MYLLYQPYVSWVELSSESPTESNDSFIINLLIYTVFAVVATSFFN